MIRAFLAVPTLLLGCELVVDFDRDRIVLDAGVDSGPPDSSGDDARTDTGLDAGEDAGEDAEIDASEDAGTEDAGPMDGGDDAGDDDAGSGDAGGDDAGTDSGLDAGTDTGTDAGMACTMPNDCSDGVACTVDDCVSMACTFTPSNALCDDSDDCTADTCSAPAGCEHETICSVGTGAMVTLADLTTVVPIGAVLAAEAGFVAVYDDAAGSRDMVLGSTAVGAGMTASVSVPLGRPVTDGETLYFVLHVDAGTIGTFEPATDPVAQLMAADVERVVTADVPAGTPDVEVTVSGTGADYTFSASRPAALAIAPGNDPVLTLRRGFRYRIINNTSAGHPLELIDEDDATPSPATDIIHLSQDASPALEMDGTIMWSDSVSDRIVFTVSPTFEANIDAYRCAIHVSMMRNAVAYIDP